MMLYYYKYQSPDNKLALAQFWYSNRINLKDIYVQ